MTVITMTREMGSQGRDVAVALAEELGLRMVQHELVEHVAEKMHRPPSAVNRFLEGQPRFLDRWGIKEGELSLYTAGEILELASEGNVLIRGWGATHVLRPVRHVLSVRVCSPEEQRARVLMARIGLERYDLALKEVRRNDAAHARLMQHLFHVDWRDPLNYDLTLNTQRLSAGECVETIKELASHQAFQETEESRRALASMKIQAKVRAALHDSPTTQHLPASFEVEVVPDSLEVILRGILHERRIAAAAVRIAGGVAGVKAVRDEISVIPSVTTGV